MLAFPGLVVMAAVAAALGGAVDPAVAAYPGTNGKIAFDSNRDGNFEVYVMNADGSGQTRLTNDPATDSVPAWSADGSKIVFTSNRDGNDEVYVMNADGTGQVNLTNNAAYDAVPTWSPDGSKIAFASTRDGNYEIYAMNADGSGQTRLTNDPTQDFLPAWSPDGSKIAFTSIRGGNQEIVVMNADGTGQVNLTNNVADDYQPDWSPDGSKVAFFSFRGGNYDVYVMNVDGTGQTNVTNHSATDGVPAWSPDGSKIAFGSDRSGDYDVYVMSADGSNPVNLTNNAGYDDDADWQPITVPSENQAPTITNPGPKSSVEGAATSFTVGASDPDGDTLTFSATNLPPGFSIDSGTGAVSGSAAEGVRGIYWATVTVSDGALTANALFRWDVRAPPKTGLWHWGRLVAQQHATPTLLGEIPASGAIAAGAWHTVARRSDGKVLAWGYNSLGQLGDGTTSNRTAPVEVSGLSGIVAVAAGDNHGLALRSDGRVFAWGGNGSGQLGDGTRTNRLTPVQVAGLAGIAAIGAGGGHSLAVRGDGQAFAWGDNDSGQLGDGTLTDRLQPVAVSGLPAIAGVDGGGRYTLARSSDGRVFAWGDNTLGQLGDGTMSNRSTPAQVSGLPTVAGVSAGGGHSLAVALDGRVFAWGANFNSQLGDGTATTRLMPTELIGLSGIVAVTGGSHHSLALRSDGRVFAWGGNESHQLGDGTRTTRATPVEVRGLSDIVAVAAGTVVSNALGTGTPTALPERVERHATAGAPVTTDVEGDGATMEDPVETSVTAPVDGSVTIEERPGAAPGTGYVVLGQQVTITAPAASASAPLVIVFRLDAAAVGNLALAFISVTRNGATVPMCSGSPGVASPDPCVANRQWLDGDAVITIYTSAASVWQLLAPRQEPATIDVKPSDAVNTIPLSSKQVPVAILSSPVLDAPVRVDRTTVTFGRTGAEQSLRMDKGKPACGVEDVNGDGLADLVCNFVTASTGLGVGDTHAVLRATANDGARLEGFDGVRIRSK